MRGVDEQAATRRHGRRERSDLAQEFASPDKVFRCDATQNALGRGGLEEVIS
jgi:hypothetical protein